MSAYLQFTIVCDPNIGNKAWDAYRVKTVLGVGSQNKKNYEILFLA